MNLSVLHGIIFLWTELHRWSEIHKPEIPSHHLSHSSTPHYKLLLFCLTFIPTRNIHPGRIQQLFNLFILSIVLLFQSTELCFHSMSLILLSLYCLKEGRKIFSTFQDRKTQSSHMEIHFDVKLWWQRWFEKRGKKCQTTQSSQQSRPATRTGHLREETEERQKEKV